MYEEEMKEKIERYIHNKYANVRKYVWLEEHDSFGEKVDVIFIEERANSLHIIEAEPTFGRCFGSVHGFSQLDRFPANYKWIAVPKEDLDEYQEFAIESVCKEFGFGLIFVYPTQLRQIIQPEKTSGNFLNYYPYTREAWNQ